MPIQLRDYQSDAISATIKARNEESITRSLVSLPTGTGKTLVFSELARRLQAKTLILAHRDELIRQAADKVSMVWPGASIGIIKAQENNFQGKNVVCASVQTLARTARLNQITDEGFNLLVIDEAHHSTAQTYQDIIQALGFFDGDPDKLLLGVSATCFRSDKKGLGHIFQKVVYSTTILTMIRAGYLADIKGYRAYTGADISSVDTRQGDFVGGQLARAINTEERNQIVIDSYLQYASKRKAIAFCASVEHAEDLADRFNDNGIIARALSGDSPEDKRREVLRAFANGEVQVLTNCALFTEGFDEPSIDCVLMCRPTKSQILYTQCIGRGTRKHPGKTDCIVIDFADNRHDICCLPQLLGFSQDKLTKGETVSDEIDKRDHQAVGGDGFTYPVSTGEVSIKEFDLLGKSVFRWIHDGVKWRLPVGPGAYTILNPTGNEKYLVYLFRKDEGSILLHPAPLPLGYAQGISEDYARKNGKAFSRKDSPWRDQPVTDKQIDLLHRLGINPEGLSKGAASDILEEFFAKKEARRNNQQYAGVR